MLRKISTKKKLSELNKKEFNFIPKLIMSCLILIVLGCSEESKECGCESEPTRVINSSDKLIGQISYKYQIDPNDTFYNDTFWIGFDPGCNDCEVRAIVCNENILDNKIKEIKETDQILEVQFSGEIKEICNKKFDLPTVSYERITLTSIEIIE